MLVRLVEHLLLDFGPPEQHERLHFVSFARDIVSVSFRQQLLDLLAFLLQH